MILQPKIWGWGHDTPDTAGLTPMRGMLKEIQTARLSE